jgi:AcrR family transcriptional regulator
MARARPKNSPQVEPESPWRKPGDRTREREIKREAVLRTAAQLFNEKGFHAVSLDEVAERLNVTKPTLYYYVKNKDEILAECVRSGLELMQEAIARSDKAGGTAIDKLMAAMRTYAEIVTMDFGKCLIRVGEDPLPPESRREVRRLKAEIDREFRHLIEQGIAEGSLRDVDPKLAAFTLAGALSWIGRWYRADGELSPDQIAERCIGVLMGGLAVPPKAKATSARAPRPAAAKRISKTAAK